MLYSFSLFFVSWEVSGKKSALQSLCPWIVAASVTRWFLIIGNLKTLLLFSSPVPLITASQSPAAEKILLFFNPHFHFAFEACIQKEKKAEVLFIGSCVRMHVQALVFTPTALPLMSCLKTSNSSWWFHNFFFLFFFFYFPSLLPTITPCTANYLSPLVWFNLVFPGSRHSDTVILLLPSQPRIFARWHC